MFEKGAAGQYVIHSRDNQDTIMPDVIAVLNSAIKNKQTIRIKILNPQNENDNTFTCTIVKLH